MYTANLRKVGGSVMVAVPPALLEILEMTSNSTVMMSVEGGRLVIEPRKRKKYSLQELLSQCDETAPISDEDRAWSSDPAKGKELI